MVNPLTNKGEIKEFIPSAFVFTSSGKNITWNLSLTVEIIGDVPDDVKTKALYLYTIYIYIEEANFQLSFASEWI